MVDQCECCNNKDIETQCMSCKKMICNGCWGVCSKCHIKTCETCKATYGIKHYRCVRHQYGPNR